MKSLRSWLVLSHTLPMVIRGALVAALLIGAAVGWLLALELDNSLARLTETVQGLTTETETGLRSIPTGSARPWAIC
jgi:hypothetical protein